jgi:hypothetical protein
MLNLKPPRHTPTLRIPALARRGYRIFATARRQSELQALAAQAAGLKGAIVANEHLWRGWIRLSGPHSAATASGVAWRVPSRSLSRRKGFSTNS